VEIVLSDAGDQSDVGMVLLVDGLQKVTTNKNEMELAK